MGLSAPQPRFTAVPLSFLVGVIVAHWKNVALLALLFAGAAALLVC